MGLAQAGRIKMRSVLQIKMLFLLVYAMQGQAPQIKLPQIDLSQLNELNATDLNQSVTQPPKRSSQLETINKAGSDLRFGKEGDRVGAAKLLGKYTRRIDQSQQL